MIGTTHKQAELLDFIVKYHLFNDGVSPSFEEMKDGLGLASKSGVHRLLTELEYRGLIRRLPYHHRAIEVTPHISILTRFSSSQLVNELARRGEQARAA